MDNSLVSALVELFDIFRREGMSLPKRGSFDEMCLLLDIVLYMSREACPTDAAGKPSADACCERVRQIVLALPTGPKQRKDKPLVYRLFVFSPLGRSVPRREEDSDFVLLAEGALSDMLRTARSGPDHVVVGPGRIVVYADDHIYSEI